MPRPAPKTAWTSATAPRAGKRKGAKDLIPRSEKASVKMVMAEIVSERPEDIRKTLERGLFASNAKVALPYVALAAQYLDTKPGDKLELTGADGGPLVSVAIQATPLLRERVQALLDRLPTE